MTLILSVLGALTLGTLGFWLGRHRADRTLRQFQYDLAAGRGELKRRLDEIYSLQELAYLLADTMSIDKIADRIAQYITRFITTDGALVALFHAGSRNVNVVGATGSLGLLKGRVSDITAGSLTALAVVNERLETASGSAEHPISILEDHVVTGTAAAVPLQAHGEILGTVALVRDTDHPFDDTEFRLLSTAATHAALALGNARFVELIRSGKVQWEATFDAITDGIAVIDRTGHIRRANHALADLLDAAVVDLIGRQLAPLLVGNREIFDEIVAASQSGQSSTQIIRSDVLNRVLRITMAWMGDELSWTVVLIEDVTEQQALEAAVIQSEKMAAVGQLVSGVAHELNNPLTSISGLTEFLLQQPYMEESAKEHLEIMREQADRAATIVRNLLTFARQGTPGSENVDMNDVVERTSALTQYEVQLRGITLAVEIDPDLSPVFGDRFQLQQVVLNLVTNAIHAVEQNPPERARMITVRTSQHDETVVIDVADTGPGIPSDVQPRIFDPFYTTKGVGEGTGLGLSITYGIVQSHGGDITAESSDGGGSRFVLSLPSASTSESSSSTAPAHRRSAELESTGLILLYDRDTAVRQMMDLLFTHIGHDVVVADTDQHPESVLDGTEYDLVVADPRVPVSSGDYFADWLRREHPDLIERTIFLTADVREGTRQWLEGIGSRFFHKPFNVQELRRAANEVLRANYPDGG